MSKKIEAMKLQIEVMNEISELLKSIEARDGRAVEHVKKYSVLLGRLVDLVEE